MAYGAYGWATRTIIQQPPTDEDGFNKNLDLRIHQNHVVHSKLKMSRPPD